MEVKQEEKQVWVETEEVHKCLLYLKIFLFWMRIGEKNSQDRLKSLFFNYKIGEIWISINYPRFMQALIGKIRENRELMFILGERTDKNYWRPNAEVVKQTLENWNQF